MDISAMISSDGDNNYYDLLEVQPDASPAEIRQAYLRVKAAYKKDSVALYTLISEAETESLLKSIEEAFQILSNPERRRDYDRRHGSLGFGDVATPAKVEPLSNVISIDRVPPMETIPNESDILVPPSTDFTEAPVPVARPVIAEKNPVFGGAGGSSPSRPSADSNRELMEEIEREAEWSGAFFRRVRETRRVAIEELADFTKIGKNYLLAIEEENYGKLPAAVFLRGFVTQIARYLRLPQDKAVPAYMDRYTRGKEQKLKAR